MSDDKPEIGRIRRFADGFEARFERILAQDQSAIWRMLTDAQALGQWLAPGRIEPRSGGAVHIDFGDSGTVIQSTVLAFDPPRLLEYSWSSGDEPQRPLRWELAAIDEEDTRLVLILHMPAGEDIAKACAGFDAHLEMLAAALEGVPISFPFSFYLERRTAYQEALTE